MQNLNDYKWTKIEMNRSQLHAQIWAIEGWIKNELPISDVCKMNLHAYKVAQAEAIKFNFSVDDTIEFEIITKK